MVPNVGQRLLRTLGDFAEQKPLKTCQLNCLSLLLVQGCQSLLNDSPPFLKSQTSPRGIHTIRFDHLKLSGLVPVIEIPQCQILSAAQASVISVLENPRFGGAFRRIKSIRFVENFKKDFLHHVLCLTCVAKNSQSNFQNKPVKAIKKNW